MINAIADFIVIVFGFAMLFIPAGIFAAIWMKYFDKTEYRKSDEYIPGFFNNNKKGVTHE